jgi:hypothetical protein
VTAPEHGSVIEGAIRQSALRMYDQCPDRAVKEATRTFTEYSSGPASLGTAFHMFMEEFLRTLRRQGEQSMPTEEAVAIMREVIAQPDCPHLSVEQQRELLIVVLQAAQRKWPAHRIVGIEERLFAMVPCPDGRVRRITGKPDVLLADPPKGAVCLDYKVSWAVPPSPRDGDFSRDGGRPYLSERGTFQLDTNGLLIMRNFPAIKRVILREYYPRLDEIREAVLSVEELEHVERRLGLIVMRFEQALGGEIDPEPRPGKWCSHCPVSRECPVPEGDREPGVLDSPEAADAEARRWQVVSELDDDLRKALKNYHEETGYAPAVGDGRVARWDPPIKRGEGKRKFGLFPAETTSESEEQAA